MSEIFDIQSVPGQGPAAILRARGRLEAHSAAGLLARSAEVRKSGRHLVLNLSGVTFIASSGVGALLALVEEYQGSHLQVRIAAPSPAVDSVVRLLNLERFLVMSPTEDEAVATLEAA